MSIALRQEKFADDAGGAAAGTLTITPTSAFLAGSIVVVYATVDTTAGDTGEINSVADSLGNLYINVGPDILDSVNHQRIKAWYANNVVAGSPTITVTYSTTLTSRGVYLAEVTGGQLAFAPAATAGQSQASPGTGTDAVTSGLTGILPGQPALLICISGNFTGSDTAPATGTGFTVGTTGWTFGTANAHGRSESKVVSSTAAVAATYTTTFGTDTHLTAVVVIQEASQGGAPSRLVQTAFAEISANTTTTSTTFVDLLSLTITTGANPVIVDFSVSADNSSNSANQTVSFQLLVDGVAVRGTCIRVNLTGFGSSAALVYKIAQLAAGSHTIKVQWSTSASTARVRPVATSEEHASLLLEEVTS